MNQDDVMAELRAAREAYAKQFNYDLRAMYEDLKRKQEQGGQSVVTLPPKRASRISDERVRE